MSLRSKVLGLLFISLLSSIFGYTFHKYSWNTSKEMKIVLLWLVSCYQAIIFTCQYHFFWIFAYNWVLESAMRIRQLLFWLVHFFIPIIPDYKLPFYYTTTSCCPFEGLLCEWDPLKLIHFVRTVLILSFSQLNSCCWTVKFKIHTVLLLIIPPFH